MDQIGEELECELLYPASCEGRRERKREEGSGFPHDTDTQRCEGKGWRAGLRLNMKTEGRYYERQAKR